MNGKGSRPRPLAVSREQFEDNWDEIFGKKPTKKQEEALEEMVRLNEEMGLYEMKGNPLVKEQDEK